MRPRLIMSMMQLDPLPNRAILERKIRESFEFIDQNKNIKIADLPTRYINLWRVRDDGILENIDKYPINDDSINHPSVYISFTVFCYIYYRYYTGEDYADFQNFLNTYKDFQQLLCLLSIIPIKEDKLLGSCKIFDFGSLTHTLDLLRYNRRS